jgi:hypothetical protein
MGNIEQTIRAIESVPVDTLWEVGCAALLFLAVTAILAGRLRRFLSEHSLTIRKKKSFQRLGFIMPE